MDLEADLAWNDFPSSGFMDRIGHVRYAKGVESYWTTLELEEHHMFQGACHSSVLGALADTCMGIGAYFAAQEKPCAVIDFDQHFFSSAKLGQTLVCRSKLNRITNGLVFMDANLWADDRHCMRASGIWKVQ